MFSKCNKNTFIYYIIIALGLLSVLLTNPFLKYPYDMLEHLIVIDNLYNDINSFETIPESRIIWHSIWANIFTIFDIPSSKIFLRAKIIHLSQTYLALLSLYYFSNVVIRNVFKEISPLSLSYLSLWSVVIWISVFATFSIHYHLVWNLWYSVNYQITLPLFWYITALTIVMVSEKTSIKNRMFFILQILLLSVFILQAHAMEYLYYLMYLSVLSIVYIDKLYNFFKQYYYLLILMAGLAFYFINNNESDKSEIFNYLSIEKFPLLYDKIMSEGNLLIHGINRSFAVINELMYLICVAGILMILHFLWNHINRRHTDINIRMLIFIFITSLFVLIPLNQYTGGLFAMISRLDVVHRIYYSSSLFVILPMSIYYLYGILNKNRKIILHINISIFMLISFTWLYSKYDIGNTQNYYKNISSIKDSFFERRVGFNLSKKEIALIGENIHRYENNNTSFKNEYYFARADIAFVIKYIYGKKVYWEGRRKNPDYKKQHSLIKNTQYHNILFKTPKNFPEYIPYR